MAALAGVAPALIARARADQVATIYASWTRTTASMLLGAADHDGVHQGGAQDRLLNRF